MAPEPISMTEFVDEAARHIRQQTAATHRVPPTFALAAAKAGAAVTFCTLWPGIKEGLDVLKGVLPVWARWMVSVLEAIGDKACAAH